jgi:hypothetical protein
VVPDESALCSSLLKKTESDALAIQALISMVQIAGNGSSMLRGITASETLFTGGDVNRQLPVTRSVSVFPDFRMTSL